MVPKIPMKPTTSTTNLNELTYTVMDYGPNGCFTPVTREVTMSQILKSSSVLHIIRDGRTIMNQTSIVDRLIVDSKLPTPQRHDWYNQFKRKKY